jgi:hypothetical protein
LAVAPRAHRKTLDQVIELLLERETIDGADLTAIVGDARAGPAHDGWNPPPLD